MKLKRLLERIALQRQEEFPFPDDLESYLEDFVPNMLLKSETLKQAFGIADYEMEGLYEEAYDYYESEDYPNALTLFRWLILFDSFQAKYWMGFAATLQLLKRYEKALHAYAVGALLDHENPYPHYHAYACYIEMNNKEDAEKALEMAYQRCNGKAAYNELKDEIEQLKPKAALT